MYTKPVWSLQGNFGLTETCQNMNHGSTKLVWYATKAYQKGMITYKCQNNQKLELADSY